MTRLDWVMRTLQKHNVMTDHSLHETYVLVHEAHAFPSDRKHSFAPVNKMLLCACGVSCIQYLVSSILRTWNIVLPVARRYGVEVRYSHSMGVGFYFLIFVVRLADAELMVVLY